MKARLELLEMLGEAEQDVQSGNVAPLADTIADLRHKLLNGELT